MKTTQTCFLRIADFSLRLDVQDEHFRLPRNYKPFFSTPEEEGENLCRVEVTDIRPDENDLDPIYDTSDLGFRQQVLRAVDGAYIVRTYHTDTQIASVMHCSPGFTKNIIWLRAAERDIMNFGFNNALMIAFAFSGAYHKTLAMHSSVVCKDGTAYMFLGRSGTGKSTHSALWLKTFEGFHLLNDDNPVLRVKDNGLWVYGSPWSGKTPCYRQERARVGGIVMLEQAPANRMWKEDVPEALASLMISCSLMVWDRPSYNALVDTMSDVIGRVGVHHLQCLPDQDAARLCRNTLAGSSPQS